MVNNPPEDKAKNVECPWGEEVMRLVNCFSLLVYNTLNCVHVVPKGKSLTINKNVQALTTLLWQLPGAAPPALRRFDSQSAQPCAICQPYPSLVQGRGHPRGGTRAEAPPLQCEGAAFTTRGARLKMAPLSFPHGRRYAVAPLRQRLRPPR